MNRKSGSGSGPFLMEMLVSAGFFIICASICVLVFVKADRISRQAWDMNQAVEKAQSLAEELKAGQEPRWSNVLPDHEGHEGMHAIYWDRKWQIAEPSAAAPYMGIISQNMENGLEHWNIVITRNGSSGGGENVLFRLETETYEHPYKWVLETKV